MSKKTMQDVEATTKKHLCDGTGVKARSLFNMSVSEDDRRIIRELHEKHAINVSQFVRNALRRLYDDLEARGCKGKRGRGGEG